MRRDLQINFGTLDAMVVQLRKYRARLDDMHDAVCRIDQLLRESEGLSVEALCEQEQSVLDAIATYRKQIVKVEQLIAGYIEAMTAEIKPIAYYGMTRVDSNDTYWNIIQMQDSVGACPYPTVVYTYGKTDEEEASNWAANEHIRQELSAALNYTSSRMSDMWTLHQKAARYEDCDDTWRNRANVLYHEFTSWPSFINDIVNDSGQFLLGILTGATEASVNMVGDTLVFVFSALAYIDSGIVYVATAPFGATPDFVKDYLDKTNASIAAIFNDPWLLVEGIVQQTSDNFEHRGLAYGIGSLLPDIALTILGSKGLHRLNKLKGINEIDNIADAGKVGAASRKILRNGEQFDDLGKLKPNIRYQTGEFEYIYETDELGRIKACYADELQLTIRDDRLRHDPNSPGKQEGDHAGHLLGDRFGGSPELDNIVSQLSGVNLSEYKILENKWAKAIEEGKPVSVEVKVVYEGNNLRPSGFDIKYTIDGKRASKFISNS